MTNQAEGVLYSHLVDIDSLDVLARAGFGSETSREVIPTEIGRKLVGWALDYFWSSGRLRAPTKAAIIETWGDDLEAMEIEIDDQNEIDSVEWAIEQLRADFVTREVSEFVKVWARSVYESDAPDRVKAVEAGAGELYALLQQVTSRENEAVGHAGFEDVLARHNEVARNGYTVMGLTFGMAPIDESTFGIHPGELCIIGAPSGVGKSWIAAKTLLAEWRAGRRCVLVTLENDVDMTYDRLAVIEARVDYERLQRGQLDEGEIQRIKLITESLRESPHAPIVTMLEEGQRDPAAIVHAALSRGADSVIVDQLDFVEDVPGSKKREEPARIGERVRHLKLAISTAREKLPMLLLHQINRDGQEAAEKTGRFKMRHFAGSSQVEKTADMLFVIYQSEDMRASGQGEWQTLKIRRGKPGRKWQVWLRFDVGDIRVIREITDEDES